MQQLVCRLFVCIFLFSSTTWAVSRPVSPTAHLPRPPGMNISSRALINLAQTGMLTPKTLPYLSLMELYEFLPARYRLEMDALIEQEASSSSTRAAVLRAYVSYLTHYTCNPYAPPIPHGSPLEENGILTPNQMLYILKSTAPNMERGLENALVTAKYHCRRGATPLETGYYCGSREAVLSALRKHLNIPSPEQLSGAVQKPIYNIDEWNDRAAAIQNIRESDVRNEHRLNFILKALESSTSITELIPDRAKRFELAQKLAAERVKKTKFVKFDDRAAGKRLHKFITAFLIKEILADYAKLESSLSIQRDETFEETKGKIMQVFARDGHFSFKYKTEDARERAAFKILKRFSITRFNVPQQ